MKIFDISDSKGFSKQMRAPIRKFFSELNPRLSGLYVSCEQDTYLGLLQALHAVIAEGYALVDWDLLEECGLTVAEERKRECVALEETLAGFEIQTFGDPEQTRAAITTTFGMSLGMVFALNEVMLAASSLERSASMSRVGFREVGICYFFNRRSQFLSLRKRMLKWISDNSLSEIDRKEALFASLALEKFAARHFSVLQH